MSSTIYNFEVCFSYREEEGRDLLGKRTMDFKVTYLDAGLTSAYFNEGETPNSNGSSTGNSVTSVGGTGTGNTATKVPKRYKAHLRDFLSSCRTKRSKNHHNSSKFTHDLPHNLTLTIERGIYCTVATAARLELDLRAF